MSTQNTPLAVNFHLWPRCNLKCRFCYAGFRDVRKALPTPDACRVIEMLAAAGTEKITFVGGEPTLHPDLPALVRRAADLGLTTCIVTNGFRLMRVLEQCPNAVHWVGLSVDSACEDVQAELGRGPGTHVRESVALAEKIHALGIRLKLNTVVTSLNWQEDMSELVRRMRPERWKAFQVLQIEGENEEQVRPLLISDAEYQTFVARHEHLAHEGLGLIAEDNDAMRGSYVMIDPQGRFFSNEDGRYTKSAAILDVGVDAALSEVGWRPDKFEARGGLYDWRTADDAGDRRPIVAIEGLDGCGKSTTVRLLKERLGAVVICNPPQQLAHDRERADGLPPAERRAWYIDANKVAMNLALATTAGPVVLDRSIASTLAFGVAERGAIAQTSDVPAGFPLPELILLLSLPEQERRKRHAGRGDDATTEEQRLAVDDAFRARVLAGYENLCTAKVDADATPNDVVDAIVALIEDLGRTANRSDGGAQ